MKTVYLWDSNGKLIEQFGSTTDCMRYLDVPSLQYGLSCGGVVKGKYKVTYSRVSPGPFKEKVDFSPSTYMKKPVFAWTIDGVLAFKFDSVSEAAIFFFPNASTSKSGKSTLTPYLRSNHLVHGKYFVSLTDTLPPSFPSCIPSVAKAMAIINQLNKA